MESEGNLFTNTTVLTAILIGASVLILVYIAKLFRSQDDVARQTANKHEKLLSSQERKKDAISNSGKSKKKLADHNNRWTSGRGDKQAFNHPWLLTTLKGHTGEVLDMDFSSNGKYLASCADEDPDPGGELNSEGSSGSECNKENSRPPSVEPSPRMHKGLSRRQRKNRRREDASPPDKKKSKQHRSKAPMDSASTTPSSSPSSKKQFTTISTSVPSKQFLRLNMSEKTFCDYLSSYLLNQFHFVELGYPIECDLIDGNQTGGVMIYKNVRNPPFSHSLALLSPKRTKFDVNAREFVPRELDRRYSSQGSGSSSDTSDNLEDSEDMSSSSSSSSGSTTSLEKTDIKLPFFYPVTHCEPLDGSILNGDETSMEQTCVRCGRGFFTTKKEYLTQEHCVYHWGKLREYRKLGDKRHGLFMYTCCQGKAGSKGCLTGKVHVWNGIVPGMNGPYHDFVRTRRKKSPPTDGNYGLYAIDCEMCYTVAGLELTKVTVVGMDGRLVYDTLVKPENEIVDYNTRFSGISAKDFSRRVPKTLKDVQNDLMGFINANTILIGHGLENDLRALKFVHYTVVDTTVCFPHCNGLPFRRSLKSLSNSILHRDIQCGKDGHNSYEDAATCMDLMLWAVRRDMRDLKMYCMQ